LSDLFNGDIEEGKERGVPKKAQKRDERGEKKITKKEKESNRSTNERKRSKK